MVFLKHSSYANERILRWFAYTCAEPEAQRLVNGAGSNGRCNTCLKFIRRRLEA
jgi:hypothetical protein